MEQKYYSISVRPGNIGTLFKISYFFEFYFEYLINSFFHLILKIGEIFPDPFFPRLIIGNLVVATLVLAEIFFFSPQLTFSRTFQPGSLSQMLLAMDYRVCSSILKSLQILKI